MARGSPWRELRKTATRMIADADIQRAAKELVERYGDNAIAAAKERVEAVSTSKDGQRSIWLCVFSLQWKFCSLTSGHKTGHRHDASPVG